MNVDPEDLSLILGEAGANLSRRNNEALLTLETDDNPLVREEIHDIAVTRDAWWRLVLALSQAEKERPQ